MHTTAEMNNNNKLYLLPSIATSTKKKSLNFFLSQTFNSFDDPRLKNPTLSIFLDRSTASTFNFHNCTVNIFNNSNTMQQQVSSKSVAKKRIIYLSEFSQEQYKGGFKVTNVLHTVVVFKMSLSKKLKIVSLKKLISHNEIECFFLHQGLSNLKLSSQVQVNLRRQAVLK